MDNVTLEKNVEILIDPTTSDSTMILQNTMPSMDDFLFVSRNGGSDVRDWLIIQSGQTIKFSTPVYVKQRSREKWVFPIYEAK